MATDPLLALSRRLHEATDLEGVMARVLDAVRTNTRYRSAYLNVLSADGCSMEVVGYAISDTELMRAKVPAIAVDQDPFLQLLFTAEEPVIIPDLREHPLADQKQVETFGNRTVVSVPMLRLAQRIGCLNTGSFAPDDVLIPSPAEVDFLVQVASLISVVVGRLHAEDEAKALEARMRGTQRLESLGRLAGEIAHDFNNVLVSIIGNADLAADSLDGHEAEELVVEIQEAAQRAAGLTRQLLTFSRGQVLDRRALELAQVVDGLAPMLRRLMPPGVTLEAHHEGHTRVFADGGQLEQLLMNLVLNARDALPPEGGTIRVRTARIDAEVRLQVEDDGAGMPEEVREQIFEPFFTTKGASRGTGLGLAVVSGVVQQHEGRIDVHSVYGEGTRFDIFLPAHEEATAPPPVAPPAPTRSDPHVLVVDDDEPIRALVRRVLTEAGYRVGLAEDGRAALAYLDTHETVDLVLTDIVMPNMSGTELVEALSDRESAPAIVVMSGYARGHIGELESHRTLTKPFAPSDLLMTLKATLQVDD